MAGVYGVNLYQRLYQGSGGERARDLSPVELLVLIPILAGILWLGIAPNPQLERIEVQSRVVLSQLEPPAAGLAGDR